MARRPRNAAPPEPRRRLGDLAMVWRHARRYPRQIAVAAAALATTSAATIGIPYGFKRVIDRGFASSTHAGVAARLPRFDRGR